jgi:hypothetical protein
MVLFLLVRYAAGVTSSTQKHCSPLVQLVWFKVVQIILQLRVEQISTEQGSFNSELNRLSFARFDFCNLLQCKLCVPTICLHPWKSVENAAVRVA